MNNIINCIVDLNAFSGPTTTSKAATAQTPHACLARPDHIIRSRFHLNRGSPLTDLEVRPDECHLH